MAYVKLDCGMLDSTLWIDRAARELFITALLMAEPRELQEPMRAINVRDLSESGFEVPIGWYGFVEAAGSGIVRRCGMEMEPGLTALERLGEPEAESRTPTFDGRRMVRVSGGYIILNYDAYRTKDHTAAERSRRYREKKASRVSNVSLRVASRSVTQAEAEAEAEAEKKDRESVESGWNELPSPFRKIRLPISQGRRTTVRARLADPSWASGWKEAMGMLPASDFLKGKNDRGWVADFEFFIRPDSVSKILEGKYNNGAHKGHSGKGSSRTFGTANERRIGQYDGVGKV